MAACRAKPATLASAAESDNDAALLDFVEQEGQQLTGYVPEAASVVEAARSHLAGARAAERCSAASRSPTGDCYC